MLIHLNVVNNGIYWILNYVACDIQTECDWVEYLRKWFECRAQADCIIAFHGVGMFHQNQPRFLSQMRAKVNIPYEIIWTAK